MGYFDSVADKLKDVKPPIQRRYCEPGVYILGIKSTRMQKSGRIGKPDTFIAEFITLQSNNPSQEVGALVQWAPSMAWDSTMRDIMAFIAAVAKKRFEDVQVAHMNAFAPLVEAGAPVQPGPAFGKLVKAVVRSKEREGKSDFTTHDWYPCPLDVEPALLKKFEELTKKTT